MQEARQEAMQNQRLYRGLDVGTASVPQPRPPPGERTRKLLDPGAVGAPREERLLGLGEKAKGRLLAGSR